MDKQNFLKALALLATQCNKALSQAEVSLYDRGFGMVIGYGPALVALEKCLMERKAADLMPSVGDLRRLCAVGQELTIEEQAEGVAAKLVQAIGRRGYYWYHAQDWPAPALVELGEWGYAVVKQWGGWQRLVDDSGTMDMGVFRSQVRRLALTVGLQARAGVQAPPSLPSPATGTHARGSQGLTQLGAPKVPAPS